MGRKGTQGDCVFIHAGVLFDSISLQNADNPEYPYGISYNIVQLDVTTGQGFVLLRRFGEDGRFVEGYRSRFQNGEYRFQLTKKEIPRRKVEDVTPPGQSTWDDLAESFFALERWRSIAKCNMVVRNIFSRLRNSLAFL